uniref:IPPc domain-containing protein n=1 Tax=Meloidogyne hapla TaxID=6305 RepID=A0A1I8BDS0_MELHA
MDYPETIKNNEKQHTTPTTSRKHHHHNNPLCEEHLGEFHSQFCEQDFQRQLDAVGPRVTGPGGVILPTTGEVDNLLDHGPDSISAMCFTWNIAGKASRSLSRLNHLFAKMSPLERPSLIALALQELPASTLRFHSSVLQSLGKSLSSTHRVFCWVRKWSQMLVLFIKHPLSLFTSQPEYRFVAGINLASPFRTKGAISIRFRLFQCQCIFVACHLAHGKLERRILDYRRIAAQFDFDTLQKESGKNLVHLFWFGDLNFRVLRKDELSDVAENMQKRLFRRQADFQRILAHDELSLERANGLFKGFREAIIKFPPTHKFRIDSNFYMPSRMPSYTDRVLFWTNPEPEGLTPIRYDCVWEVHCSDHKPVYCIFKMKVMKNSFKESKIKINGNLAV